MFNKIVSIPQAVGTIAIDELKMIPISGFVSIPQAVGTIAIESSGSKRASSSSVSIPQAVGTIAMT